MTGTGAATGQVAVDRGRCGGAGQCVLSAPELFQQSDDGRVTLIGPGADPLAADRLDAVREAVALCPAGALRIVQPAPRPPGRRAGAGGPAVLAQLLHRRDLSVRDLLGQRAVGDLVLPHVLFVLVYAGARDLSTAVWSAALAAVALTAVRLARRTPVRHALGGLAGIAVSALIAAGTGQGEDFYLPDLVRGVVAVLALLVSMAVRWPLIGVVVGPALGQRFRWRGDPRQMRAYQLCTAVWAAVGTIRQAVQVPLYLTGDVVALGVAHVLMGFPLLGVSLWVCWAILRQALPADPAEGEVRPDHAL